MPQWTACDLLTTQEHAGIISRAHRRLRADSRAQRAVVDRREACHLRSRQLYAMRDAAASMTSSAAGRAGALSRASGASRAR